jgi:hypothetical protein
MTLSLISLFNAKMRAAVSHSEIRAGQVVQPGAFSGSAARTSLRLAGSRTREKIFFFRTDDSTEPNIGHLAIRGPRAVKEIL